MYVHFIVLLCHDINKDKKVLFARWIFQYHLNFTVSHGPKIHKKSDRQKITPYGVKNWYVFNTNHTLYDLNDFSLISFTL